MVTRAFVGSVLMVGFAVAGCEGIADIQELPGPPGPSGTSFLDPGLSGDGGSSSSPSSPAPAARCDAVCGVNGTTDCCDSPLVPAGTFSRNYDARDFTDSSSRGTVVDFRLDRFEVTLGRFRGFVAAYAGGWRPAVGSGKNPSDTTDDGWDSGWTSHLPADGIALEANIECHTELQTYARTVTTTETRPINCVTWYVAFAFCIWDGGRLPTDTEWNYAAAGGREQRYYPWNDDIDTSRSSYYVDSTKQCFGDHVNGCAVSDLTAVGTHDSGAGKWGQQDLSGNVTEWMRDGTGGSSSSSADGGGGGHCQGCYGPPGGGNQPDNSRHVRGGAFNTGAPGALRVAASATADPTAPSETIGVRCARLP